jgi:curved DNA-binding protein CbpA
MNGQLSEQPLAELIREISSKSLGGKLRLEHERVKVVVYFETGKLLYAASNLKTLRLREYLRSLVSEQQLAQFDERTSDADLLKNLCTQDLLSTAAAQQVQIKQITDVLRMSLLPTEGLWEFDFRSRLNEKTNLKIDVASILLEAGRRMNAKFVKSRFPDPDELITPLETPAGIDNLLPAEGFLLSRLDRPMHLRELLAVSGVGEAEALALVYPLALAGLIQREHWKSALPGSEQSAPPPAPEPEPPPAARDEAEDNLNDIENFLERITNAQTHYDVLEVTGEMSSQSLKATYYQLAKRYHPDKFRKSAPTLVTRLESAFAKITQAYDILRDDRLRANYDEKLKARSKAAQLADSAPKATSLAPQPETDSGETPEAVISAAERAELQFKEGFAAFEMGQRQVAMGLFAAAASAVPSEPRYRAYHGHLLATNERTRRAAESELLAAIKLEPSNADYRVMLAELYRDLGLKLRAKGEAERALTADPSSLKARELLRTLAS